MSIKKLESIHDKDLIDFKGLKSLNDSNLIVIDGIKSIQKLVNKGLKVIKVLADPTHLPYLQQIKHSDTEIFILDKSHFKSIVGSHYHQNIIAIAEHPSFLNISDLSGPAIALNALTSPENVGSILRSASAFNIKNIIIDNKTVSPFIRRCIRVSMGNVFSLNLYKSNNFLQDIISLKLSGYKIISTANTINSIKISETPLTNHSIVIIGNEGHGIEKEIISQSNYLSKIDINNETAHLNASIAASIFMYELSNRINLS